ncbi:hypothetical protein GCM10010505_48580 [Kitasatospora aburaviensis]
MASQSTKSGPGSPGAASASKEGSGRAIGGRPSNSSGTDLASGLASGLVSDLAPDLGSGPGAGLASPGPLRPASSAAIAPFLPVAAAAAPRGPGRRAPGAGFALSERNRTAAG